MDPTSDKRLLRARFAALRDGLPTEERARAETAMRNTLFSLPVWKNAPVVCGYTPTRGEIDLLPVWERAVALGKTYALPVTVTGTAEGRMIFRRLSDFAPNELTPARFGISEPAESCPALTDRELAGALLLVPGLAFDNRGFRLGYGGGYYDRFLDRLNRQSIPVTTVGLVFSACRTDTLSREAHDIPVDLIIDERSVTVTHGAKHP